MKYVSNSAVLPNVSLTVTAYIIMCTVEPLDPRDCTTLSMSQLDARMGKPKFILSCHYEALEKPKRTLGEYSTIPLFTYLAVLESLKVRMLLYAGRRLHDMNTDTLLFGHNLEYGLEESMSLCR